MYNAFLLTDFYKLCHMLQYPDNVTHFTAYLTPRGSRLKGEGIDKVVMFGIQGYVNKYVRDMFINHFFGLPWERICSEVKEVLQLGLGYPDYLVERTLVKLKTLYDLGYLPVEINGVPEGTEVPMGCPCLEIRSTVSGFGWVSQALEANLSAAIWHPMMSATVGLAYRKIVDKAYRETVDDSIDPRTGMCDFSMRGQESNESSIVASAGWLTAMFNSSTVMARSYIQENYSDSPESLRICGLTSTEHSVMTAHACLDNGDEYPTFEYLLNLYKDVNFAAVSDSYDFWNVLTNILPKFKETIDERGKRGKFIGVRHDSADPVEAVCGIPVFQIDVDSSDESAVYQAVCKKYRDELSRTNYSEKCKVLGFKVGNDLKYYTFDYFITKEDITSIKIQPLNRELTWEEKGMVETIWDIFGGSVNSKGFKVLNPGTKAVYGDSITITRAREIYERLKLKGFAANNVSLGVGSFSFQCLEGKDGSLLPLTRDSFSIAIKATYSKYIDKADNLEKERFVFKSPKNFTGKKSHKGLCHVWFNDSGDLEYCDELTEEQRTEAEWKMRPTAFIRYFGRNAGKTSFNDIRDRIDIIVKKNH